MNEKNTATKNELKIPFIVLLAFSNLHKRKHAIYLIWASILFTAYCFPYTNYTKSDLISNIFLIDEWSWIVAMIPVCIWYLLSLRWMDKNNAWDGF